MVEPGVTLEQLNAELAPLGLVYPVSPGEQSGSLGGNVATNAGGMRAVRYGVTRHHVLGLEVVLADGTVLRTGGKFVKCSSGYDLTQLLIGSEGTLAVTTEVTVKLQPRLTESATVLAPFAALGRGGPGRAAHRQQRRATPPSSSTSTSWSWRASPQAAGTRPRRDRRWSGPDARLPRRRARRDGRRPGRRGRGAPGRTARWARSTRCLRPSLRPRAPS